MFDISPVVAILVVSSISSVWKGCLSVLYQKHKFIEVASQTSPCAIQYSSFDPEFILISRTFDIRVYSRDNMHAKITKNLALTAVLGLAHGQTCPRSSESAMNLLFSVIMPTKYTDYTVKSWLSENESLTFKEGERKLQQWQMGIRAKNTIQRIVNGYDTPADEAPYYVRILSCQNGASCGTCGASWISSTTILTAAHCHASNGTDIYYYKNPSDNSLQPSYTSPNVDSWIFHPCWDENGSLFQENYDVLVLTVTDAEPPMPIRLATPVNFAGLSSSYPSGNNDFISYGFGRTIGDGSDPTPSVLQRTYGIEYFSCSLIVYANGINRDDILCFNIENEHAICQGDSGGPRTKDSILYGLHSGFLSNTGGADCATNSNLNAESPYSPTNIMMTGSFSFDVSVAHYRDWIIENSDYSTDGVEFYGDQFTTVRSKYVSENFDLCRLLFNVLNKRSFCRNTLFKRAL